MTEILSFEQVLFLVLTRYREHQKGKEEGGWGELGGGTFLHFGS